MTDTDSVTNIYRRSESGDELIGCITPDMAIHRLRWGERIAAGRVDERGRVFRNTQYDERELGTFSPAGRVHSHGLLAGGELGWLDPDGVVVRGGLIFGEEEVGRVAGPHPAAAAAALLLLFLPDEAEAGRRSRE